MSLSRADGCIVVSIGFVHVNARWQHLCQQLFCLLFLNLQLLCPLSDELLQVGGVLLQHPEHGVNDVGLLPLIDVLKLSWYEAING